MKAMFRTLLICSILVAMPLVSFAGIYKYRDANGQLTFVDDKSKIPAQFRDNTTSVNEAQDSIIVYDVDPDAKESPAATFVEQEKTDRAAIKKKLKAYQTPVKIKKNRVLVPVAVAMGNRVVKLSLLLDTGATTTVLHRQSLTELDLPNGKRYKARVAGGGIVKSEKIRFRQIEVGPFKINKAHAMVINLQGKKPSFDGMLGMDFLKHHPYQIDFKQEIITWEISD